MDSVLQPGAVIVAAPTKHGRFPVKKARTHIVMGLHGRLCVPTSAGQCRRKHLVPTSGNGLHRQVDLMTSFRTVITPTSRVKQIGQLSEAELLLIRRITRLCWVDTLVPLL